MGWTMSPRNSCVLKSCTSECDCIWRQGLKEVIKLKWGHEGGNLDTDTYLGKTTWRLRRQPSASQEHRPRTYPSLMTHKEPTSPTPWSQTSGSRTVRQSLCVVEVCGTVQGSPRGLKCYLFTLISCCFLQKLSNQSRLQSVLSLDRAIFMPTLGFCPHGIINHVFSLECLHFPSPIPGVSKLPFYREEP